MHTEDASQGPVGLIPAAGYARRLGDVAGSKEAQVVRHGAGDPRPAAFAAVDQLRNAGVTRAVVVLREGKEDVRTCLGDGATLGVRLEYVMTSGTPSVAHSVDLARPRVADADVALAWPDVLYEPADALARTRARRDASGAEVCLGLFPTRPGDRFAPVLADPDGRVRRVAPGPAPGGASHSWVLAVWGPAFTGFLQRHLAGLPARRPGDAEPSLGDVFQAALEAGLEITGLRLDDGRFLDIGVPEDLARARRGA